MARSWSRARANIGQAYRTVKREVSERTARVDQQTDGKLSTGVEQATEAAKRTAAGAQHAADWAVAKVRTTERGERATEAIKGGIGALGRAPVLTIPSDMVAARQGLAELVELHATDPFDPRRSVWLAEGLLRAERDRNWTKLGRTVVSPGSMLVRGAVRALDDPAADSPPIPVVTQLLAMAYVLALAGLDKGVNAADLHSLARVYLARGAANEAVRLAQGTVAMGTAELADGAFTLALAQRRRGADDLAAAAAEVAIEHGSSLGYGVLVELGRGTGGSTMTRDLEADYRERILRSDLVRYYGVAPDARTVAGTLWHDQLDRGIAHAKSAAAWAKKKLGQDSDG